MIWPSSITWFLTSEKVLNLETCEKRGQKNKQDKITAIGTSIETKKLVAQASKKKRNNMKKI